MARGRSILDTMRARIAALGIALLALAALAFIHRADIAAIVAGPVAAADDPLSHCIAERHATIDKGVAEGVFGADQAALFKQRATALCQATVKTE
ncbi:MAG: hypothetical protein HQ481_00020 [Alphaproteobacteria bacterium]|nr:hypothetical protein [Alphaproteobacteria bacterium]